MLVEFLVISLFYETKIPTVDMKVQVYFKFSNFFWKEIKSQSSMRNGRFHPPKCRGKLQKMGVLYTRSPKMLVPSPNNQINKFKKSKKTGKMGPACSMTNYRPRLAGDQRLDGSGTGPLFCIVASPFSFLLPPIFSTCGQLLLIGSSTCPPCPNFS
jgi:hypothetical protein